MTPLSFHGSLPVAGAVSALKCLSRAHTDGFLFGQILCLEYEIKERVSPSWAPVTGDDLLGGLQNLPWSSPGRDSSVALTTVCLFPETLRNRNEALRLYRRKYTATH